MIPKHCESGWVIYTKNPFGIYDESRTGENLVAQFNSTQDASFALTAARHHHKMKTAINKIIAALNGNPDPVHYKVKDAIDDARKVLMDLES